MRREEGRWVVVGAGNIFMDAQVAFSWWYSCKSSEVYWAKIYLNSSSRMTCARIPQCWQNFWVINLRTELLGLKIPELQVEALIQDIADAPRSRVEWPSGWYLFMITHLLFLSRPLPLASVHSSASCFGPLYIGLFCATYLKKSLPLRRSR